jgi:hypothetical protein
MIYNCAACNAPITLKSNRTKYVTCSYCSALNCREENDFHTVDGVDIANNFSVLKIGQKLIFENKLEIELIGRLVADCEDGGWNEWFCLDDNGNFYWLCETMGDYFLMTEEILVDNVENYKNLKLNDTINMKGKKFYLTNNDHVQCIGVEGELPSTIFLTSKWVSLDFKGHDKDVVFINIDSKNIMIYYGRSYEYDEFKIVLL